MECDVVKCMANRGVDADTRKRFGRGRSCSCLAQNSAKFARIHNSALSSNAYRNGGWAARRGVRTELDALLTAPHEQLPRSALNLFLAARMSLARNLEELMRYSIRVPAAVDMDYGIPESSDAQMLNDRDGALAFTRGMPTSILVRGAEESKYCRPS